MSEQTEPQEPQTTSVENVPDAVDLPEPQPESVDLLYGYTIGVKEDGELFFQTHGTKQGSVELLGINKLAKKQIETIVDANLSQGTPQLLQGLSTVFNKLLELEKLISPTADEADASKPSE